jgi:hypothetical protein
LRKQLQKALADDPALAAELADWVDQAKKTLGTQQMANVNGHGNAVIQVSGSGINIQH